MNVGLFPPKQGSGVKLAQNVDQVMDRHLTESSYLMVEACAEERKAQIGEDTAQGHT